MTIKKGYRPHAPLAFVTLVLAAAFFLFPFNSRGGVPFADTASIDGSMPLAPYAEFLPDPTGKISMEEMFASTLTEKFRPLSEGIPLDFSGTLWLRFTLAPTAPPTDEGQILLDLSSHAPRGAVVYTPKSEPGTNVPSVWQGRRADSSGMYSLPPAHKENPTSIYVRIPGTPDLWFTPSLRTVENAETSGNKTFLYLTMCVLGVLVAVCLLRAFRDGGEWRLWTAVLAALLLAQPILKIPSLPVGFSFYVGSILYLLIPSLGLAVMPHIARHLWNTQEKAKGLDIFLVVLTIAGGLLPLMMLLPSFFWVAKLLPLWPLLAIFPGGAAFAAITKKMPGSGRFLLCALLLAASALLTLFARTNIYPDSILINAPLWAGCITTLLLGIIPIKPINAYAIEKEKIKAAATGPALRISDVLDYGEDAIMRHHNPMTQKDAAFLSKTLEETRKEASKAFAPEDDAPPRPVLQPEEKQNSHFGHNAEKSPAAGLSLQFTEGDKPAQSPQSLPWHAANLKPDFEAEPHSGPDYGMGLNIGAGEELLEQNSFLAGGNETVFPLIGEDAGESLFPTENPQQLHEGDSFFKRFEESTILCGANHAENILKTGKEKPIEESPALPHVVITPLKATGETAQTKEDSPLEASLEKGPADFSSGPVHEMQQEEPQAPRQEEPEREQPQWAVTAEEHAPEGPEQKTPGIRPQEGEPFPAPEYDEPTARTEKEASPLEIEFPESDNKDASNFPTPDDDEEVMELAADYLAEEEQTIEAAHSAGIWENRQEAEEPLSLKPVDPEPVRRDPLQINQVEFEEPALPDSAPAKSFPSLPGTAELSLEDYQEEAGKNYPNQEIEPERPEAGIPASAPLKKPFDRKENGNSSSVYFSAKSKEENGDKDPRIDPAILSKIEESLKVPLESLMRAASELSNCSLPPLAKVQSEAIVKSGEALAQLVNTLSHGPAETLQMLDANADDSNKIFDLQVVLREAHDAVAVKAERRGLALSWFMPPHMPLLYRGNPTQLQNVLSLLLDSAIESTSRGSVQVAVRRLPDSIDPGHLVFTVTDTGQTSPHLRRSTTALMKAWEMVVADGGTLSLDSTPNQGTVVSFTLRMSVPGKQVQHLLPLLAKSQEQNQDDTATGCENPELRPLTILVADEQTTNRQLVAFFLNDLPYVIEEARSAAEALETYTQSPVGLVIFDNSLPELDLEKMTRSIHEIDASLNIPPVPVVALVQTHVDANKAIEAGCHTAIRKPLSRTKVRDTVDSLLPVPEEVLEAMKPKPVPIVIDLDDTKEDYAAPQAGSSFLNMARDTPEIETTQEEIKPRQENEKQEQAISPKTLAEAARRFIRVRKNPAAVKIMQDDYQEESMLGEARPVSRKQLGETSPEKEAPTDAKPAQPRSGGIFSWSGESVSAPRPIQKREPGPEEMSEDLSSEKEISKPGRPAALPPVDVTASYKRENTGQNTPPLHSFERQSEHPEPEEVAPEQAEALQNEPEKAPHEQKNAATPPGRAEAEGDGDAAYQGHKPSHKPAAAPLTREADEAIRQEQEPLPDQAPIEQEKIPAPVQGPAQANFEEEIDPDVVYLIPGLLDSLDMALQDAHAGRKNASFLSVSEACMRIAGTADAHGLRVIKGIANCVERAANANDMEAVDDLLAELDSSLKNNRKKLEAIYHHRLGS